MHDRFFEMLTNFSGFFQVSKDKDKMEEFLKAYYQIFLYAPDKTILKLNNALISMGYKKTYINRFGCS